MVQPQNIGSAVEEFLSLLHLSPYQEFVLEQNDPGIILLHPPPPPPPSFSHTHTYIFSVNFRV